MRMMRSSLLFVGVMLLQWWWNTHLAYWGAAPQFLLALTILIAARRGPVTAMLIGFAWGIFSDTLRADLFGANALLYAAAGYWSGMARKQIDLRAMGPLAAVVFILSWGYALMIGVVGLVFQKSFLWIGWVPALFTPFLNALTASVAAVIWEAWGEP